MGDPLRLPLKERLGDSETDNSGYVFSEEEIEEIKQNYTGRLPLIDRLGSDASSVSPEEREAQEVNDTLSYIITAEDYNKWPTPIKRVNQFERAMRLVKEYAPEKFSEMLNISDILGVWVDDSSCLYPNATYARAQSIVTGRRDAVLKYQVDRKVNAGATKAIDIFIEMMNKRITPICVGEEATQSQESCGVKTELPRKNKRKRR